MECFVTCCQDGFSTSPFSVCLWLCPAWRQNLACDSYQECGGVEPIPSGGSGHWPVSRLSSIPVGNDTIYWRCDGRRFRRDHRRQDRTTSDTYLELDEGAGPSSRQWNERSESELTRLQENRHSKSTAHPTKWAAKIFRGASAILAQKLPLSCELSTWYFLDKLTNIDEI